MKNIDKFVILVCTILLILNMAIGISAQQQSEIKSIDIKYNGQTLSTEDGQIKQKMLAKDTVEIEITVYPTGYEYIALQTDLERMDNVQGLWREILPTSARDNSKFFDANNKLTYIKTQGADVKIKLIGKIPNPTVDVPYKYGGTQSLLKEKKASLIKLGGTNLPEKGVYDSFYDLSADFTHPDILDARGKIKELKDYINKYKDNPDTKDARNLYSDIIDETEKLINEGYPEIALNLISILDKKENRNVIFVPMTEVIKRFAIENPIPIIIGIIIIIVIIIAGISNIISLKNKNINKKNNDNNKRKDTEHTKDDRRV